MMADGSITRRVLIHAARGLAVTIALPLLYLILALSGGLIPANWSWQQPERGIRIFVQTNGVHTWIVVPKVTRQMDWRPLMPAEHVPRPDLAGSHLAIGYGNREFYLNTPAWEDLTAGRALRAAVGNGRSLIHVYHETSPEAGGYQRPITITPQQYERLVRFILASLDRTQEGRTIPLIGRGYGSLDVFYEARGGYNLFYTCNEWTGEALRKAGIRIGIWTPFSHSIMMRF